ncbi:MAG: DUF1573 domain-containing protein [Bacteroidales bacterium]|nr:DUF1573 domain-containing protein [Bacteroidales bacterium]MCF8389824.1 DUF1573 domain-containing protein [Bacteroidales bacterium]
MKKLFFILILSSFISAPHLFSQQKGANISFDKLIHDFGEIKEADGIVTYNFNFTNTGNEALIIQKVNSSCGCTTPTWTRQPIGPGEKGIVSAAYNPQNRPGHFDKYITVETNSPTNSVRLQITGNVISKPVSIEDQYTFAMGGIRLKTNHLSFGTVFKGVPQTKLLEIINTSDIVQKIELSDIPAHLKATVLTPSLKPGETGNIKVDYLSDKQSDWDFIIDRISVSLNGVKDRTYKIVISANIQEDFSSLTTEQRNNAPIIEFSSTTFNFGKLAQGENVEYEYPFKNNGKSDLLIRKVNASCGCTAILTDQKIVGPGQSASIKVSFNSAGKMGAQNKTVTVITNDPLNPRIILWIKGDVIAKL